MSNASKEGFRPTPNYRERRRRGMVLLKMTDGNGLHRPIMVRDVSAKGISAAAHGTPPAPDEIVCVYLPNGRSAWGLVRWVTRNLFGVEFGILASDDVGKSPEMSPNGPASLREPQPVDGYSAISRTS